MELEYENYWQSCRSCLTNCESLPNLNIFRVSVDNKYTFANVIEKITGIEVINSRNLWVS